ncbi:DUF6456 domain-containing protein [Rhizobium binxianense]
MLHLLKFLARGGGMAVVAGHGPSHCLLRLSDGASHAAAIALVDEALSRGLAESREGALRLSAAARSYLRRAAAEREEAFLGQHGEIEAAVADVGGEEQAVRIDRAESPLSGLSRLKDKAGAPFLPKEALAAGERLLADFTRGNLQPRVTSSWEPRLASRGKGARGGMADLTDSAVAARHAVNRAVDAMGPELSGVALDVCCFMKGLETVERERQWPARSAKLMLRTALLALARHYNPPARPRTVHWGADGYRPEM